MMKFKNNLFKILVIIFISLNFSFFYGKLITNIKDKVNNEPKVSNLVIASQHDNEYLSIWNSSALIGDIKVLDIANDIDSDGNYEFLAVNGYRVEVFEYNETQQEFFSDGSCGDATVWAMCFGDDLDNDGHMEILHGGTDRILYIEEYDSYLDSYSNVYQYDFTTGMTATIESICVGDDLDGDGKKEIVVSTYNNKLTIFEFNGTDNGYNLVWQTTLTSSIYRLATSDDLDNDGKPEILASTYDGRLIVLESSGADSYTKVWDSGSLFSEIYSICYGNDLDKDGKGEILVGSGNSNKVEILEFNGTDDGYSKVWDSGTTLGDEARTVCSGNDLDQDGMAEILAVSVNGIVYIFEYNGTDNSYTKVWDCESNIGGVPLCIIDSPDLNGNGNKEFLIGSSSQIIYIFEYDSNNLPEEPPQNGLPDGILIPFQTFIIGAIIIVAIFLGLIIALIKKR